MTAEPTYPAQVLDRRALVHGGRVYLAGEKLDLTFEEMECLEGTYVLPLSDDYVVGREVP